MKLDTLQIIQDIRMDLQWLPIDFQETFCSQRDISQFCKILSDLYSGMQKKMQSIKMIVWYWWI